MNATIMRFIARSASPRFAKAVASAGAIGVGGGLLVSANVIGKDLDPAVKSKAQLGLQTAGTALVAAGAYMAGFSDSQHWLSKLADDAARDAHSDCVGYIKCKFTGCEASTPGFIVISDMFEEYIGDALLKADLPPVRRF